MQRSRIRRKLINYAKSVDHNGYVVPRLAWIQMLLGCTLTFAVKKYSVRVATTNDAASVTALLQASYPKLMQSAYDTNVLAPALELMTKAQTTLLVSGTYYVAESQKGQMVGCGGWTRERPGDGIVKEGVGHIRHFGTHPEWTKCGIGRAIYSRCETDGRNAGLTRFECYSSLNAESFYSAIGFEHVRRVDIEMVSNVVLPSVFMQRRI